MQALLNRNEIDDPNVNPVIKNLFDSFKSISSRTINVKFIVITLSEEDPEFINRRLANSRKETLKEIQSCIGSSAEIGDITVITVKNILSEKSAPKKASMDIISFDGSESIEMNGSMFLGGIGKLSDLVELFKTYGNHLFERNVRYYLFGKRNEEHGPAGKIKETLRNICMDKSFLPAKFAFLHNGITLFAEHAEINSQEKSISLKAPCILNGCQTIKASYYFLQSKKEVKSFDSDIWNQIPITIRIVVSKDNKLWREVAEANNRQNSLKPSALKANDEVQIKMEHLFKKIKIFYERQEGAFKNISTTSPVLVSTEYQGSTKEPITFEKLARAMVLASDLPIYLYNTMHTVFENNEWYEKIFSETAINEDLMPYYVLLSNLQKVIHLALNEIVSESGETGKYSTLPVSKFQSIIFRLLAKTIEAKNEKDSLIQDYGFSILGANNSNEAASLREKVKSILRSKEFPIMQTVEEIYKEGADWKEPYDMNLGFKAQKKLNLENIQCIK